MTIYISDHAEEYRIEISGRFADRAVGEAADAWKAALSVNIPRRICVDITRMTGYDREGYKLLREFYSHGTHIAAATPRSLLFLDQISSNKPLSLFSAAPIQKRESSKQVVTMQPRAAAAGE